MANTSVDKLRALLPPLDSRYSSERLDEAEARAFDEALGDGFGWPGEKAALPKEINRGLLSLSFFCRSYLNVTTSPR
jgi:hypothetical protein